mgnify:CR=1 FL=1
MKTKNRAEIITAVIMFGALVALLSITLVAITRGQGKAEERAYWEGYNDAYNSVQAEYERGVGDGWRGCIEENNLYDRY